MSGGPNAADVVPPVSDPRVWLRLPEDDGRENIPGRAGAPCNAIT